MKIIEHDIKNLEGVDDDSTDYLVRKNVEYNRDNPGPYDDEENLFCQSSCDNGKELNFV